MSAADQDPCQPAASLGTQMTQQQAPASSKPYQEQFREDLGLHGGQVQAGHVNAERHEPESGITPQDLNDPQGMMALPPRRNPGLDVAATRPAGATSTYPRHNPQSRLLR